MSTDLARLATAHSMPGSPGAWSDPARHASGVGSDGPQVDVIRAPREAWQRWAEAEASHAALNEARDELARRKDIRLGRA